MPPSTTVKLPPQLVRQLRTFRRRLRTVKMLEAVCLAGIAVILSYALLYLSDRLWETPPRRRLAPVFHRRVRPGGVYSLVEFPVGVAEAHGIPAGAADFPDGRGPGGSSPGRHRTGFRKARPPIRFRKAERGGHGAGGPRSVRPGPDGEHPPAQPQKAVRPADGSRRMHGGRMCGKPGSGRECPETLGPPVQSSGTLYVHPAGPHPGFPGHSPGRELPV